MIRIRFAAAALAVCSLFTPVAHAAPPAARYEHTAVEWRFRVVHTAPDGAVTKTAWSEWMAGPVNPPRVTPPRHGSVAIKIRTRPVTVIAWH